MINEFEMKNFWGDNTLNEKTNKNNNMEAFNEMMRTLIGAQQKTLGLMYENTKTPIDFIKDYNTFMENNMKFHNAAIKYHQSLLEMVEAMKSMSEIYKFKP